MATPKNQSSQPDKKQKPISTTPSSTSKTKKLSVPIIVALAVGGFALVSIIAVLAVTLLGGKVDYAATYEAFKPLKSNMDELNHGSCYDMNHDFDDENTSISKYNEYVAGCAKEFSAIETAINDFSQSSGVKHDEDIKSAFDTFRSTFNSIYSKQDFESQLALYGTYHEFYLTFENADSDVKGLESAINSASKLFEDTNNSELKTFANGFRERGIAYVNAIKNYQNNPGHSSSLYSEVRTKMNEFTDYIENSAPEVADVTGLDFTKVNDLEKDYSKLHEVVRNAYNNR